MMKIPLPGNYTQFTERPHLNINPIYWLTKSHGKWLIHILIFQAIVFYSMPVVISYLPTDFVFFLKDLSLAVLSRHDQHAAAMENLRPEVLISGLVLWLTIIPEIIAVYYMLSRSGRDLAVPSILNKEKPVFKGLLIEELFMDRRKFIGKTKQIGITRRVIGSFLAILTGSLFFMVAFLIPESIFILKHTEIKHAFNNDFLSMFMGNIVIAVMTAIAIIPIRDYWKAFYSTLKRN